MNEITIASLAERPYWVAWQTEKAGPGKPRKIPYDPQGLRAKANDPATWGIRLDAERRASRLAKPFGAGGVGLEFTEIGDGLSLGGIDFDSCRTEGKLEGWAEDVIAQFDTYTEVSPSGSGVKSFFIFETKALTQIRKLMGDSKFGKKFSRDGGEHPPAIELHMGNRYFTVTDHLVPGSQPDLRHVDARVIEKLLRTDGPSFAGASARSTKSTSRGTTSGGADRSRSADAYRVGKEAVRDGANFEEMCDRLRADASTSDWMREKGEAAGFREARRIFDRVKSNGRAIRIVPGELHITATEGEEAIIAANVPIFQRGYSLVRPVTQEVPAANGRMTVSAALNEINGHGLVDTLCACATWERYDSRAEAWLRINAPRNVADTILSRAGHWHVPVVVGVITTPTVRPDGSIMDKPGFDPSTRLYHAADPSLMLSPVVARPTRADATTALALLNELLSEFPFVGDVGQDGVRHGISRSVALSAMITPVARGAIQVAPLQAIRASTPGTGKSYLLDVVAAISSGRECPVIAVSSDEAETEKRLVGMLMSGFPIISMDNVNGELGGDLLCQATERPIVRIRPLGGSQIMEIVCRSSIFCTGNNLRVRGDMVRRTIVCDMDAGVERPEKREFNGKPVETVLKHRQVYVSACLTIVRAYILAGRPGLLPALASYGDWSDNVRSALVWLGCDDPAASMEAAREDDPELGQLRELITAWLEVFPVGEGVTVKQLADAADERARTVMGEPPDYAHPTWRDCLIRLAGDRGSVNTTRLARWIMDKKGRVVGKHRVTRAGTASGGVIRWAVEKA